MLNQTDQKIVQELKVRLQAVVGGEVQAVIVYGSRVWGRADPDSDWMWRGDHPRLFPEAGKRIAGSGLPGHLGP